MITQNVHQACQFPKTAWNWKIRVWNWNHGSTRSGLTSGRQARTYRSKSRLCKRWPLPGSWNLQNKTTKHHWTHRIAKLIRNIHAKLAPNKLNLAKTLQSTLKCNENCLQKSGDFWCYMCCLVSVLGIPVRFHPFATLLASKKKTFSLTCFRHFITLHFGLHNGLCTLPPVTNRKGSSLDTWLAVLTNGSSVTSMNFQIWEPLGKKNSRNVD